VYHLTAGNRGSETDCFYVSQERANGSTTRVTPCIREQEKAIKVLKDIKAESNAQ